MEYCDALCLSRYARRQALGAAGSLAGGWPGGRRRRERLILAEIEFLSRFSAERIADELLVAFRAEIVAKVLVGRGGGIWIDVIFLRLPEHFADRFHVVIIKVGLRDLVRLVAVEDLNLDH